MKRIKKSKIQTFFEAQACLILVILFTVIPESHALENVKFVQEIITSLSRPTDVAVSGDKIFVVDQEQSKVFIYGPNGELSHEFGTRGSNQGEFNSPLSLAVTPQEEIVVADSRNNRVQVFNKAGKFVYAFGTSGTLPGQFRTPCGVVTDQFGFIFIADRDNQRIQIFTPKGVFLKSIDTGAKVSDVGIDPERNLYALIPETGRIVKYSPEGKKLKEITCVMNGVNYVSVANGINVDMRGDIYLAEGAEHSIKKLNSDGEVLISFGSSGVGRGQFEHAAGIASDANEQIFVADTMNGRIEIFKIVGSKKKIMLPERESPLVLDFDAAIEAERSVVDLSSLPGRGFYLLSEGHNRIFVKGRTDKVVGQEGKNPGELKMPEAFYVTMNGKIYVADTGNNRLQIFAAEGTLEYEFGKPGKKAGQFLSPQGIAVNSKGFIYVADTLNHRIQMFNNDGIFLQSFGETDEKNRSSVTKAQLRFPKALDVDSRDRVCVLDYGNDKLKLFTDEGEFVGTLGGPGEHPGEFREVTDVAFDENDYLYVADQGNHRIQIFDPKGMFVLAFGTQGKGRGYFEEISAIAVSEGEIFVADYKNDYVQVFRFSPEGLGKKDRLYVTKTVEPPRDYDGNDVLKHSLARNKAKQTAINEIASKFGLPLKDVSPFVKVESIEILNNGQVAVTVSSPGNLVDMVERIDQAKKRHPVKRRMSDGTDY